MKLTGPGIGSGELSSSLLALVYDMRKSFFWGGEWSVKQKVSSWQSDIWREDQQHRKTNYISQMEKVTPGSLGEAASAWNHNLILDALCTEVGKGSSAHTDVVNLFGFAIDKLSQKIP